MRDAIDESNGSVSYVAERLIEYVVQYLADELDSSMPGWDPEPSEIREMVGDALDAWQGGAR